MHSTERHKTCHWTVRAGQFYVLYLSWLPHKFPLENGTDHTWMCFQTEKTCHIGVTDWFKIKCFYQHRTEAYKKTIALQTFSFWSRHVLAPFVLRHSQYTDKGLKKSQGNYTNKNKNRLLVACLQCVCTALLCTVCCMCSVSGGFSFSRSVPRKYF